MEPKNHRFGGGATETFLHPLVVVWMLVAIALIFTLPRKKVVTPFLISFFLIPDAQVVVLGGAHLTMHQILILAVLIRMATFRETPLTVRFGGGFDTLDKLVVLWTLTSLIVFCIQFTEVQAWIRGVATLLEELGGYLAARFLVPDREAVNRTVRALAVICAIQGVCMLNEQFTHQNVFSFAGANWPTVRNGHVRSEGAMGNLWGGAFAGACVPLFLWLWTEREFKIVAFVGITGATAMVFATYASTSWMAFFAGVGALGFWPLRKQMRLIRWGIITILIGLHLVMNGPVWSLLEKIDLTGGSSSYHRYMLVDNCIRHFGDWWLFGYKYYGQWGFDMWDLCNQFVAVAVTGGLISLILFIMIYSRGFGKIGRARTRMSGNRKQEWLLWCLGSTLFVHVVASFGINYMVQLVMALFVVLACIQASTFSNQQATVRETHSTNKSVPRWRELSSV